MPNTGMINNQTYKCNKCRRNFGDIWLSSKTCCRIALREKIAGELEENRKMMAQFRGRLKLEPTEGLGSKRRRIGGESSSSDNKPLFVGMDQENYKRFRNKLAPFWTMEKPSCGVGFSRDTDNKKQKMDIEPSNLVRWRNF